ncbi:MAG: hypothetical protein MZV70_67820 [Desulfobacterales bacterium]|nr:hypothetical protein [Desulfobacterales bacterium]
MQDAVLEEALSFAMACELGRMEEGLAVAFAAAVSPAQDQLEQAAGDRHPGCGDRAPRRDRLHGQSCPRTRLSRRMDAAGPGPQPEDPAHAQAAAPAPLPGTGGGRETTFMRLRQRLTLGESLQLAPPRDFEGTRFTLTLNFENLEEVGRLRDKLDELVRPPGFQDPADGQGQGIRGDAGAMKIDALYVDAQVADWPETEAICRRFGVPAQTVANADEVYAAVGRRAGPDRAAASTCSI